MSTFCIFLVVLIQCKAASSARTLTWFFDSYPIPSFIDEEIAVVGEIGRPISPGVVVEDTGIDPISIESIRPAIFTANMPPSRTDSNETSPISPASRTDSNETSPISPNRTDSNETSPISPNRTDSSNETSPAMGINDTAREGEEGGTDEDLSVTPMSGDPGDDEIPPPGDSSYMVIHEYFVTAIRERQHGTGRASSENGSKYRRYDYDGNNYTDTAESAYEGPYGNITDTTETAYASPDESPDGNNW